MAVRRRGRPKKLVLLLLGVLAIAIVSLMPFVPRHHGTEPFVRSSNPIPTSLLCLAVKPGDACPTMPLGYSPAPKGPAPFSPIPVPSEAPSYISPPGSIFTSAPEPFSPEAYSIQNERWNIVGDQSYEAWAGASGSNPSQGVVVVQADTTNDLTQTQMSLHVYVTPRSDGSVSITAANGTRLTLAAKDGATFTLDVATGQFF